jgi:hypothetical protein
MHFYEKISRIRTLISERDAIDEQIKELIGDAEPKVKRVRPRKENGGSDDDPPSMGLPLDHSSGGVSA